MLAHNGVEALHGRCMPNHGRGRIRAVALHAWHNQDADYPRQPFRQREGMRVLKDEMLVGEEKEIGGRQTPQGEMLMSESSCWKPNEGYLPIILNISTELAGKRWSRRWETGG